jgi:hypothetical protein
MAATSRAPATRRAAVLAIGLFFTPPVSGVIGAVIGTDTSLVPRGIRNLGFISRAEAQPAALTTS